VDFQATEVVAMSMIRQITINAGYMFRGQFIKVLRIKKGVRGWTPDMVEVENVAGDRSRCMAREFRNEAEKIQT